MSKKQGNLIRTLSLGAAIMFVVSSVIGSGVYKKVAPMMAELQAPWLVLIAFILAGLISLFGALSNAEIAGMMAESGGEYVYFKKIYGRFTAFIYGWSTFITIKTASVASIAYVFAQSVNNLIQLPEFDPATANASFLGIFQPFQTIGVKVVAIILIILLTYINTKGIKHGANLSLWITRSVFLGLAIVVISALFFSNGSITNFTTPASTYESKVISDFGFIKSMFAAMLAAFWAYEGWNTVGFIGAEIKEPNKNLPIALFSGMLIIIITYILVNFSYMYVLNADQLISVKQQGNKIAAIAVIEHFWSARGGFLLSIIIIITTLGCTNSTIIMPPRIYNTMAIDGLFFEKAKHINTDSHTPNGALWIQCIWACLLVLSGTFDQLTDMLIFAAFFFYGLTALGVFILRKRSPDTPRPYKVWGYPVIPALFLIFCICLIVITCYTRPREAALGLVLMLTGVPLYFYWTRTQVS
jgi:APA family basic amino acid/polyamine antiporter